MFRRIEGGESSKSASMVSMVQEMIVNIPKDDVGICFMKTECTEHIYGHRKG